MAYAEYLSGNAILWLIATLGVASILVYLERALTLHRSRTNVTDFLTGTINNLHNGNVTEAIVLCDETPGPVARILAEAIRQRNVSRADLAAILQSEGLSEISRMERRLSFLSLVAQIAPVLGLLGTICPLLGLVIGASGHASGFPQGILMQNVLASLRPALGTTAAGLVVATLATVAFHLLVLKIARLVLDMEYAAAEIVQYLDAHRAEEDSRQQKLGL